MRASTSWSPIAYSRAISGTKKPDRIVTREAYAAELARLREERPNIHVAVYDHTFAGNRAWFRFAFKWSDPGTGESRSRAGMQS